MLPTTITKIEKAFTRMRRELDHSDHSELIRSTPTPVLHAVCIAQCPQIDRLLPGASDPAKFAAYIKRVDSLDGFHSLLIELEEPDADDLKSGLAFIESLPRALKRTLVNAAKRIRPTGGPTVKLSDPVKVSKLVDEVFETEKKTGETWSVIQKRIAGRKDVSVGLKTFQRRFREEMARRKAANAGHQST